VQKLTTPQEVQVKGFFLVAHAFLQNQEKHSRTGGTLINITSTAALMTSPTQTAYGPSKLATVRIVENLGNGESEFLT
jgi:short-subunit dehydrogenase